MKKLAIIFFLALIPTAQSETFSDQCANLIGSCEYYSCIDIERLSCGSQGYTLGYGRKYCQKFSAIDFPETNNPHALALFPSNGNQWRDQVRSCLQQRLETAFANDEVKDCASLRKIAFDSHPKCYTDGPSFCELTTDNVIRIGLTIQPNDLIKAESQQQIRDTASICVKQLSVRIEEVDNPLYRLELSEYRNLWVLVSQNPAQFFGLLNFR